MPADTRYITFLREPVERVLSTHTFRGVGKYRALWNRILNFEHAERHGDGGGGGRSEPEIVLDEDADLSLEAGLARRICLYENLATRFLWGGTSIYGELPSDALEQAKEKISRFAFVGITERFDESIVLLGRVGVGLMPYRLKHLNRHPSLAAKNPASFARSPSPSTTRSTSSSTASRESASTSRRPPRRAGAGAGEPGALASRRPRPARLR